MCRQMVTFIACMQASWGRVMERTVHGARQSQHSYVFSSGKMSVIWLIVKVVEKGN